MSAWCIRLLAIIFMLIDHIGVAWPTLPCYIVLRLLGRVSFPLFAFLIANGYRHTKNVFAYLLRLGILAVISEACFDLFQHNVLFYLREQNVFFTLFLGLLALFLLDHFRTMGRPQAALGMILALSLALLAEFAATDYGFFGVVLILCYGIFFTSPLGLGFTTVLFALRLLLNAPASWEWPLLTLGALGALFPILLYNGKKGFSPQSPRLAKILQMGIYLFYPLHLLFLSLWR